MMLFSEREKLSRHEMPVWSHLPFTAHIDSNTIIGKSGQLFQCIEVEGLVSHTLSAEELASYTNSLNELWTDIGAKNIALHIHTIRYCESYYPHKKDDYSGFAADVDQAIRNDRNTKKQYVNRYYITVVERGIVNFTEKTFFHLLKISKANNQKSILKNRQKRHQKLRLAVQLVIEKLNDFKPRLLGIRKEKGANFSEPCELFAHLINGCPTKVALPESDLSQYLSNSDILFLNENVEIRGGATTRFASIHSIKEFTKQSTDTGMLNKLYRLNHEFITTQSFSFINREASISLLQSQRNLMEKAADASVTEYEALLEAENAVGSNMIRFGYHQFTVMPLANSEDSLHEANQDIIDALGDAGISSRRETLGLELAFWSQLPGNQRYAIRNKPISTQNMACFAPFYSAPMGQKKNDNAWGDAITVFDTVENTPYYFSYHLPSNDLGHTIIVSPSGTGKTTLMSRLIAQSSKHVKRTIIFDKGQGLENFTHAMDGKYIVYGKDHQFNPLAMPDTVNNRAFITRWLTGLVSTNDCSLTPSDQKLIKAAVELNYRVDPANRRLEHLAPQFGIKLEGGIAEKLSAWYGDGAHSNAFDYPLDQFDLSNGLTTIDLSLLLKEEFTLPHVFDYLFHKINQALDGEPTLIVIDEAPQYIRHSFFARHLVEQLETIRKRNAVMMLGMQSTKHALMPDLDNVMSEGIATSIFLANAKGKWDEYKKFALTEEEFSLIKSFSVADRKILIKQEKRSGICKFSIDSDSSLNAIFSTDDTRRKRMYEIMEEHGDQWLSYFRKEFSK